MWCLKCKGTPSAIIDPNSERISSFLMTKHNVLLSFLFAVLYTKPTGIGICVHFPIVKLKLISFWRAGWPQYSSFIGIEMRIPHTSRCCHFTSQILSIKKRKKRTLICLGSLLDSLFNFQNRIAMSFHVQGRQPAIRISTFSWWLSYRKSLKLL